MADVLPRRYLSLDEDAPPGFEHCPVPTRRQLRGAMVALWTREPDRVDETLGPLRDKVRGLVLCPGQAGRQTQLGPTVWRLEVGEAGFAALVEIADAWFGPFAQTLELRDSLGHCELELARERMDRAYLVDKLDHETRGLRNILVARTAWTALAMATLVSFSTRLVQEVRTSDLPASIVAFLCSKTLTFAGAGLWFARGPSWQQQAAAGELGVLELPPPPAAFVTQQPRNDVLMVSLEVELVQGERHQALLAVVRRSGFDDADVSFLALFATQLTAIYRGRALNQALALASARKDALIAELTTPIIQVWHDMVCLPIIGSVDSERASRITGELLDAVGSRAIRAVIVDFTGIAVMDTQTVRHFTSLARAIRLLGARCLMTGISPGVAGTLVTLGVELGDIETMPSVQAALASRLLARSTSQSTGSR